MANDTADILRKARALVERGWVQGLYAVDGDGNGADEKHDSAVCWCAEGAIFATCSSNAVAPTDPFTAFAQAIGVEHIPTWNDAPERTQADVLVAFDKAIALAEQEPT